MNNDISNFNDSNHDDDSIDFLNEFFKYFFFWKYFLLSIIVFLSAAFLTNRYKQKIYKTSAKILIIDKNQSNFKMPSADNFFSNSNINLENEIEIIKSASILNKVIKNLNINLFVEDVGEIVTSRTTDYPFEIKIKPYVDSTFNFSYNLKIYENELEITNLKDKKKYVFNDLHTNSLNHDLPFNITNVKKENLFFHSYNVNFIDSYSLLKKLKKDIVVSQIGKESDLIEISLNNSSSSYARDILNEIIDVCNNDGIRDRQLIHKRTIDFVNERFKYITMELESIELEKKSYKVSNNLVDLDVNSSLSLERNILSEENLFANENQIFLVRNLLNELSSSDFKLLPSNIGIENLKINTLISSYNNFFLEKQKLRTSAGPNNPLIKQLNNSIVEVRKNIIFSLNNYLSQLNIIKDNLKDKSNLLQSEVASIPSQEKILRSIERNQQVKEALYLFLLQKGEEAQVSFAVTEPNIKVVEYAISDRNPVSPKPRVIYLSFILIGILIPFSILYFIFLFDNKVHSREDLEKFSLNVLAEIPFFDLTESEKVFANPDDRSIISESFRMLMSNVRYLQKNDSESNVILVTSSIKGEGKTLNALNLALSFSSVGKKVLLIGCDLRNPQLHKYIGFDKNISGLVDSLVDNKTEWKKNIINPFESHSLDILLSGPLPPNPLNLINNGNIDILLKEARKTYDYIVIDSAPTLLVADTQSLIKKSDVLIFLTRCNVTDNDVLSHIKKVSDEIDSNVGVILNGVGAKNSYGYSYGYRYGYGYNYKYSYNYGYGYGYNEES